jgi:hypothetical protein
MLKNQDVKVWDFDWSDSGYGPMADPYEHGNEFSGPIKRRIS